jgi:transposase
MKAKLATLSSRMRFVMQNVGVSEKDQHEASTVLRTMRMERANLEAELASLEASQGKPRLAPTNEEVAALLQNLGEVLTRAASGAMEDSGPTREAVELLTGGRIELEQAGEKKAQRGWLRGRFRTRLLEVALSRLTGVTPIAEGDGVEVVIDYREPTEAERWADQAKELYDRGLLIKAIADELKINRNLARRALAAWSERTGEALSDGRSRRSELDVQHLEAPLYQRVAERVKQLLDQGLLMQAIAERLQIDRNTVTSAMRYWYQSRGLLVPDGRGRRKDLPRGTA